MNPANPGQMGQTTPNGAPTGQSRGPPMYRPEAIRQMSFLSEDDRARYERIIRQCWQQLEANGPDASEARRKIVEFSRAMVSKAQQARLMMHQKQALQAQQQAQAQQLQQQAQAIAKQQPQNQNQLQQQQGQQGQQVAQGQVQAQHQANQKTSSTGAQPPTAMTVPSSTATSVAITTTQTPQKIPEHIIQHVGKLPYHPPNDVVQKGPEAVKQWQIQYRNKYAMILLNMEKTKQALRAVENSLRQNRTPPMSPAEIKNLQEQRETHFKRHGELGRWVESFRKNQQDAVNQRAHAAQAAGTGLSGAAPSNGVGAGAGAGATPDQKPAHQGGAPSSAAPSAASIQALRQQTGQLNTQNVTATVSAAIEAAKNQQLPAGPIGRFPQQPTTSQPQNQTLATTAATGQVIGISSPSLTTVPTSIAAASAASSQPGIKTEPVASQPQQQAPPPVNTAIASAANAASASATGTPTTGRIPPTPQSATAVTPTNAMPRPLPHSQAVNAANAANTRAGQPGSAGVPGQVSTGGTPSSAPGGVIGAAPTQAQVHPHTHPGQPPAIASKFAISKQLPERSTAIPTPVQMPTMARPTMTQGGGISGGVMGQPAVGKPPGFTFEGEAKHVLSKTKLDELCRQVCGGSPEGADGNYLAPDVEELVLNLADHFVDDVIRKSCMIAKERGSKTLDIRDLQLILERSYNIRVPGYSSDELRTVRKIQPTNAWITKMSAVQAAKVTARNGDL